MQWAAFGAGDRRLYVQLDAGCADGAPHLYSAAAALVGARVRPELKRRMLVVDPAGSQPAFGLGLRALGQDVGVLAASKRVVYVDDRSAADLVLSMDAAVGQADCAVIDNIHILAAVGGMAIVDVLSALYRWISALQVVIVRVRLDATHGLAIGRWLAHHADTLMVLRPPPSTGFPTREIHGELFYVPRGSQPTGFNYRLTETGVAVCPKPDVPESWHCGLLSGTFLD